MSNQSNLPKSVNRQLRGFEQSLASIRAQSAQLRKEVVEEIETKEAEIRALNVQLANIDKTVQHAGIQHPEVP